MNTHERVYRSLLVMYPKAHRREYGEMMVQLVRDRFRDEGGGVHTVRLWCQITGDLVKTALSERTEMTVDTFKEGWWRLAAGFISISLAALAVVNVFAEWTGDGPPLAKTGTVLVPIFGVALVFGGFAMRTRHAARGNVMVGIGLLPAVTLMTVFWSSLLVAFGTLALIVALTAFVHAMIERPAEPSRDSPQRSAGR